eukprot:TRINITY_DN48687_c0_g1_i1.p1 TRINITY_DN48687_c0_g1~~TRINITY_DN48687_c0_g1_i1.p1  ORF type:complete len:263 (-),score=20.63 TRINITY_DN48687_c0_g1_i1:40-828(-)
MEGFDIGTSQTNLHEPDSGFSLGLTDNTGLVQSAVQLESSVAAVQMTLKTLKQLSKTIDQESDDCAVKISTLQSMADKMSGQLTSITTLEYRQNLVAQFERHICTSCMCGSSVMSPTLKYGIETFFQMEMLMFNNSEQQHSTAYQPLVDVTSRTNWAKFKGSFPLNNKWFGLRDLLMSTTAHCNSLATGFNSVSLASVQQQPISSPPRLPPEEGQQRVSTPMNLPSWLSGDPELLPYRGILTLMLRMLEMDSCTFLQFIGAV